MTGRLVLAFLSLVAFLPSRADVVSELAQINATAAQIAGETGGTAANTGKIISINQSIDDHIVDMDSDVVKAVNANTQSRIRELEALGNTIVAALQAHATAMGVMEAQRQFGGAGVVEIGGKKYLTDAHSPNVCSDARRARAMADGVKSARTLARQGTARAKQHNRAFANHRSATRRLVHLKPEQFEADKLMDDGITLTEEQVADLQEAILNITNPEPLPEMSEEQATTDAAKEYRALKQAYDAKLSMLQAALNYQLSLRAPTVETDQGKVSVMQVLLDSDIGKRYLNSVYTGKLELKTENGTLADVASMMAVDLFIGYQAWVTEQHLSNVMAILAPAWLRDEQQDMEHRYLKATVHK